MLTDADQGVDGSRSAGPAGAPEYRWVEVTANAAYAARDGAGALVFDDRMWLLGGWHSRDKENFPRVCNNEVWSSLDGATWSLEKPNTFLDDSFDPARDWEGRHTAGYVVHEDKMWIIGGGICIYHPFKAYNDVWATADGKNWEKITDQAPWPPRIWSSSAVYKNRLWLLTGFQAEPTWNNFDDVWYSSDGGDWNELVTETKWSPRHEVSVYVFDDKLWAVGGNAWPLQNDVWYLEIPGLCFLTQPIIEEFVNAQYTYRAKADFNENAAKVRYRLIESPDWLNIDSESGQIRGTPRDVEDVTVTVEAFDEAGETARQTYLLHILPFG